MRRIKDSKKSKEDILNVAELLFSQKGLFGTRVDEIAKNAKINKRMIYEYYGCKVDLYKAVLACVYKKIGNHGKTVIRPDMTWHQAIKKAIDFYFDYLDSHPTYVNLVLWENLNEGEFISDIGPSELKQPVLDDLLSILERDQRRGVIRDDFDPKLIIVSLLTGAFSYFSNRYTLSKILQYDLESKQSKQRKADDLVGMMISYIHK